MYAVLAIYFKFSYTHYTLKKLGEHNVSIDTEVVVGSEQAVVGELLIVRGGNKCSFEELSSI